MINSEKCFQTFKGKRQSVSVTFGFTLSLYLIIFTFFVLLSFSEKVIANTKNEEVHLYVDSVAVKDGDTLWSIAKRYKSEIYPNTMDYIWAIKECNGLQSDLIKTGMNIMVPYTVRK